MATYCGFWDLSIAWNFNINVDDANNHHSVRFVNAIFDTDAGGVKTPLHGLGGLEDPPGSAADMRRSHRKKSGMVTARLLLRTYTYLCTILFYLFLNIVLIIMISIYLIYIYIVHAFTSFACYVIIMIKLIL